MRAVRIRLWEIRVQPRRVVCPSQSQPANNSTVPFQTPTANSRLAFVSRTWACQRLGARFLFRSLESPSWAIDYATWPFEECLQILISTSLAIPYLPLCSSTHLDADADAACFNVDKLKTARFLVFLFS